MSSGAANTTNAERPDLRRQFLGPHGNLGRQRASPPGRLLFGNRTDGPGRFKYGFVQRDRHPERQRLGHAHGGLQGGRRLTRHRRTHDPDRPDRHACQRNQCQPVLGSRHRQRRCYRLCASSATPRKSGRVRPRPSPTPHSRLARPTRYQVRAFDAAANNSPLSAAVSVTTPSTPPDTTPPTVSLTAPTGGADRVAGRERLRARRRTPAASPGCSSKWTGRTSAQRTPPRLTRSPGRPPP